MSNYTSTADSTTGTLNEKPTVGEKIKAAFSSKTAEEIHAENLAKKQEYVDNSSSGTGTPGYTSSGTSGSMLSTAGNYGDTNTNSRAAPGDAGSAGAVNIHHTRAGQTAENMGLAASNALSRMAGNKQYPNSDSSTSNSSSNMSSSNTSTSSNMAGTSGTNVPVFHDDTNRNLGSSSSNTNTSSSLGGTSTSTGSHLSGAGGHGFTKTENKLTVQSVAQDALRQIDSQEREALMKAEQLKRRDEAELMQASSHAFSQLDAQAEALKQKVEREKLAAEAAIASQQASKISRTQERSEMEKAAIHQAAMQRKAELEAKANKLQHEIEELARLKTEEMLREKPGDLQFQHVKEDTGIVAKLAGAVTHKLGLSQQQTVTDSITHGQVQHQPAQVTKTFEQAPTSAQTHTHTHTQQGPYHEIPGKTHMYEGQYTTPTTGSGTGTGAGSHHGMGTAEQRQDLIDSKRNV